MSGKKTNAKGKRPSLLGVLFICLLLYLCVANPGNWQQQIRSRLPTPVPTPVVVPEDATIEVLEFDRWTLLENKQEKTWVSVHFIGFFDNCYRVEVKVGPTLFPSVENGCIVRREVLVARWHPRTRGIIYGVWAQPARDDSKRLEVFYTPPLERSK